MTEPPESTISPGVGPAPVGDELAVVAVGYEADLLAVGLVGDGKPGLRSHGANAVLGVFAHGQHEAVELALAEREQHVRLVLAAVDALQQPLARSVVLDAGVVAGGDVVGVQEHRPSQQEVELDLVVAGEARMWRAAPVVLPAEVVDHVGLELALEVHHVVGNADRLADASRVVDVLDGAAPLALSRHVLALHGPKTHRHADDVVALPRQQQSGYGGVDSPAHGNDHASLAHAVQANIGDYSHQGIEGAAAGRPGLPWAEWPWCISRARDARQARGLIESSRTGRAPPARGRGQEPEETNTARG